MTDKLEEESLLATHEHPKRSSLNKYTKITAKTLLACLASCSAVFYLGPSIICVESDSCGAWLSNLASKDAAIAIYTAGGITYAGINIYFSIESLDSLYDYMSEQKNIAAKVGKGSLILFYTLSQNFKTFITAQTISTAGWQEILSIAGTMPSALFTSVKIMKHDIPYFLKKLNNINTKLYYHFIKIYRNLTEQENYIHNKKIYYEKMQSNFNAEIEKKISYISANPNEIIINSDDYLLQLFQFNINPSYSVKHRLLNYFSNGLATLLTANSIFPFLVNTYRTINNYVPNTIVQVLSTILLNTSSFYSHTKITSLGISSLINNIDDWLHGRSIASLPYQLRPNTTLLIVRLSLLLSIFSYAVQDAMSEKELKSQLDRNLYFYSRLIANITVDFYHFYGLIRLYSSLLNDLTIKQNEKEIFSLINTGQQFTKMLPDEFIHFVERNSNEINAVYHLEKYPLPENILNNNPLIINDELTPNGLKKHPSSKSYFNAWYSWFFKKNTSVSTSINSSTPVLTL